MMLTALRYCAIILIVLFSHTAFSQECIRVTFRGGDPTLHDAAYRQLVTEMAVPVHQTSGPASCWQLAIEIHNATAWILLSQNREYNTTIHLDEFAPSLWPRAIALSSSGLWILSHEQPVADAKDGQAGIKHFGANDTTKPPPASQRNEVPVSRAPKRTFKNRHLRGNSGDITPIRSRFQFHSATGARMFPSPGTGIFEVAAGLSVVHTQTRIDLSLCGVWGRKSLDAGKIYTTGAGFRVTIFRLITTRKQSVFGIGPALETLGIFGYGHGEGDVSAHEDFSPVVNILLMGGGWLKFNTGITGHIAIGGGYSLVHFRMQHDGKTVSGFNGASLNLLVGLTFGHAHLVSH